MRSRQLGGKWVGDITRGDCLARPTLFPEKQEVGGQQKLGGGAGRRREVRKHRYPVVGRSGKVWGGAGETVFPESRSHPGSEVVGRIEEQG